jgi:hypothetical protein
VKRSAPHLGQRRNASVDLLAAEANATSRANSPRSMVVRDATENMEIDLIRFRAAHGGTRQV